MGNKIIVVGSANVDYVIHSAKMPVLGETLVGTSFQVNAGGKGLNQAIAVAKLGGEASFLGALGNDGGGDHLLGALKDHGVAFDGIRSETTPTGTAMITVVDGNNFIIVHSGANATLTPDAVEGFSDRIAESEYCVMQLEIPVETVQRVCRIAKENGTKVVLNPAPYKELPEGLFSEIDYLIPNEYEAKDISGIYPDSEENCIKAVCRLREMGARNVIITLGDRGSVYNSGDDILFCPAEKAEVRDTTSAGDCFIGALVSKLSKGVALEDAITFATKASAITVSREGASKSIPYASEIE